jgi:hypothetical protein
MSSRRSSRQSSSSAFHRAALTQTPVAGSADLLRSCAAQAQIPASRRLETSRHSDVAIVSITVINAPSIIPFVQIPIARHHG